MIKRQNNKSNYGIIIFPKNKTLLFHTPIELNLQ
jgi:hypothetical protein